MLIPDGLNPPAKAAVAVIEPDPAFAPADSTTQCTAKLARFINADLNRGGLQPFAPEAAAIKAGRLMLAAIEACVARSRSFAFETTLSGVGYRQRIRRRRELGYRISLFFLRLPAAEIPIDPVAMRVRR